MFTQITMNPQKSSRESENTNVLLQERSLDCLCWTNKRARRIIQRVIKIPSALCKVACEENSSGLKIAVVKICRTVVSAYEHKSVKNYNVQVVIVV